MKGIYSFTQEVKNETKHAKEYYGIYRIALVVLGVLAEVMKHWKLAGSATMPACPS